MYIKAITENQAVTETIQSKFAVSCFNSSLATETTLLLSDVSTLVWQHNFFYFCNLMAQ